jgi:hypothetical protein
MSAMVEAPQAPLPAPSAVELPAAPAGFASLIVADFPALFAEFREKHFTLLWRGSRDGFGAHDFHGRCDGHAPTLTLIEDTNGNVFGGFTPVAWESGHYEGVWGQADDSCKADPSLKSFIFMLKNPRNFPARKFTLAAEEGVYAIICDSELGPVFGDHHGALTIFNDCDANRRNNSCFGPSYVDDIDLSGEFVNNAVLTGSPFFTVKEIEVFEIAD